jgi:hypothetical protein
MKVARRDSCGYRGSCDVLAIVVYALRTKGYERAVFSHGKITLELEAKERSSS